MYICVNQVVMYVSCFFKPGVSRTKISAKADKLQLTKDVEKRGRCDGLVYPQKELCLYFRNRKNTESSKYKTTSCKLCAFSL